MTDNADQAAFWGGEAGQKWVTEQALMDTLLAPVLDGVIARADLQAGQRVLDIGCGTGQSTLAAGQITGAAGKALGADISPPMLALARTRALDRPEVRFLEADVATHGFEPASFDRVISRFGVMFFADSVAAFANIAKAMKPGARMCFASWGAIEENPYFTLPARMARDMVGTPPKSDPDAPGPFAFRDITKVEGILREAGLEDVTGKAEQLRLTLPQGPRALAHLLTRIGAAAGTLTHFEADDATRQALENALFEAITALPDHGFPAEINFFTGRKV